MPAKHTFEIELNPAYIAETRNGGTDLEAAIRDAIPWVLMRVIPARDFEQIKDAMDELDESDCLFHAFVGCELLGQASTRPDVATRFTPHCFRASPPAPLPGRPVA